MKIVDLRPWPTRMAIAAWSRRRTPGHLSDHSSGHSSDHSSASWYAGFLDRFMARRDRKRPVAPAVRPFLLSVGNLALGGTGKTPVVGALARDLAARGLRGAILTRGFGSDLQGPLVVDASNTGAGDEARWHAARLIDAGWFVVQSRSRPRGLRFLLDHRPGLDVVLLEDAHQTARLTRHLDIVILDRWTCRGNDDAAVLVPGTGSIFPFGPYRESARGAERAGILLVETETSVPGASPSGKPVASFCRRVVLRDSRNPSPDEISSCSWAALSGIAHPASFERDAGEAMGRAPAVAIRCRDHVPFTSELVDRILQEMRGAGAATLVTTSKDWVKLDKLWPPDIPCLVADLEIEWGNENALPDLIEERVQSLPAGF
jgi:tetraacyldisaccharide 4'-kinase